jgi:asparagine synthase (glutamine-hydrolysing)
MCGIFALLNNVNTLNIYTIHKAIEAGKKRGPESTNVTESLEEKLLFAFHRLAINGLDEISGQPMTIDNITLICNGEIYNYKALFKSIGVVPTTNSDCEIIIHLYKKFGIETTLRMLDGVYSFVLYDNTKYGNKIVHIARDPFGVRPLYIMECNPKTRHRNYDMKTHRHASEPIIAVASELKVLNKLLNDEDVPLTCTSLTDTSMIQSFHIKQFQPGTHSSYIKSEDDLYWESSYVNKQYYYLIDTYSAVSPTVDISSYQKTLYEKLNDAVRKRVIGTCDRPIACLLSGGLDSSLITALVNKYYSVGGRVLETYSIGMEGSEDLRHAKIVANYLGTKHTEVILTPEEFFNAIPEVIEVIESYDTTTVRASVGNYLIGKYIASHSEAKVIFNGDGSDELTGGYIYFLKAPSNIEFDNECRRLLRDIHAFDVLRSDKCISSNGLEPRTPFLDATFVEYYLSIPSTIRNPILPVEKFLLRDTIDVYDNTLLPQEILWRSKEAFSDGVSGNAGLWFEIIKAKVAELDIQSIETNINTPTTHEQLYYRSIFDKVYPGCADITPYFWMPKYVNATDASARSLEIYKQM